MALRRVYIEPSKKMKKGGYSGIASNQIPTNGPTSNQSTGNEIYPIYKPNMMATPEIQDRKSIGPVDREDANLEAEKGETAWLPDVQGLAAHFKIGGNRHSAGGTPLNLPDDSFIFSDTAKMKIKDPKIKAMFGKTGSKGITPADIAKQYDINEFRKTLADHTVTDPIQIRTAEQMIANYNLKLGKLGLVQEGSKGFPQGIPAVALPYLMHIATDPDKILPLKGTPQQGADQPQPGQGSLQPQGRYGMFMEDGGEKTYPYSFHAGPQDWANRGNALMQTGGGLQDFLESSHEEFNKKYPTPLSEEELKRFTKLHRASSNTTNVDPSAIPNLDDFKYFTEPVNTAPHTTLPNKNVPQSSVITYTQLRNLPRENRAQFVAALPDTTKARILEEGKAYKANPPKQAYGGTLPKAQKGVIADSDDELMAMLAPKPKTTSSPIGQKATQVSSSKEHEIKAHPGDKYGPEAAGTPLSNGSAYHTESWKGFAAKYCPECKSAEQLQTKILADPNYGPQVEELHKKYPELANGKVDGFLGKRWDFAISNAKPEVAPPAIEAAKVSEKPPLATPPLPQGVHPDQNSPWWAQDVIKTAGAAGDFMRIKKYLPWAPPVAPYIGDPTFYDPTRELASNAESANIATQGAGAFADPRQYAAHAMAIQGQGAKAAADTLGKYNNMNVGVANTFEAQKASVMNQANEYNAKTATDLYDKTTAANQNFDNSKAQARQELRQSYMDAMTNKAKTQVLNTMYPNFQIDPTTYGTLGFYKGTPQRGQYMPDEADKQLAYYDKIRQHLGPNAPTWKDVFGREKEVGSGNVEQPAYPGYGYNPGQ